MNYMRQAMDRDMAREIRDIFTGRLAKLIQSAVPVDDRGRPLEQWLQATRYDLHGRVIGAAELHAWNLPAAQAMLMVLLETATLDIGAYRFDLYGDKV